MDNAGENLRPGQLTVEEAYDLFKEYAYSIGVRSSGKDEQNAILDPEIITASWDDAKLSTNRLNSFVNVPIRTTNTFLLKSPNNEGWVKVSQKLVVVREDATLRHSIYLLNLIPEGEFALAHRNDISSLCQAEEMPSDFSGLVVYTKIQGGLPVYVASYNKGQVKHAAFLLDNEYSFADNLNRINSLLRGYSLQKCNVVMTRSFSESGSGSGSGSGGDWQYHTEGNSFQQDGYTCWNCTDSNGNHYVVADMNGDGKPDTIMGGSTDVGEGDPTNPGGGGSLPSGGGSDPGQGDINPGQGGSTGSGGGYHPDDKPQCPYGTPGCPGGINCTCCKICKGPCKCEVCHSDPCKCIRDIKLTIKSTTTGEQAVVRIGTTTERYYVPLYNVVLEATDTTGRTVIENYVAIRFGVKYEDGVAVVKGLQDEVIYTVSDFISAYCGESPSGDAWRIYGGHLIHAGPKNMSIGCNMYGCIGICKGKMGELNRKILLYSNAKTEADLARSGKFKVHVEAAQKPPLVPIVE